MTRIGSLLGIVVIAGFCGNTLATARAASLVDLATDLQRAANSWALDVPSGAAVFILNKNGRYTLRPEDGAAPADRRWAEQVRQSMIIAQHAGVRFDRTVISQASLGVWSVRLENGLWAVAASASEALALFLSTSTERPPTGDLGAITRALIDEASAVPRVTAGATEFMAVLPGIVSAVSGDSGITVSIAETTGLAQVKVASGVAPGYQKLFLYDSTSRFFPVASTIIEIAGTGTVH